MQLIQAPAAEVMHREIPIIIPYGPEHIAHLIVGTDIKALITYVHDQENLEFTIRIASLAEFQLTDRIENRHYQLEGYGIKPTDAVFGLGINGKVFRAILVPPSSNKAYLVDMGCALVIHREDPIYRLPLVVQAMPGTAIFCQYVADDTDEQKWMNIQSHIRQGNICYLRVVGNWDSMLQVRFATYK